MSIGSISSTPSPTSEFAKTDPEALAFLRRRVGAYGAIVGAVGFLSLLMRFGMAAAFGMWDEAIEDQSVLPHAVGATVFTVVWVATRVGPVNWRYLVVVEAVGMLLGSYAYIWMGSTIPIVAQPVKIVYGVLSVGFFARAVFVPSPPRRTAVLGVLISIPFAVRMHQHYSEQLPHVPSLSLAFEEVGYEALTASELGMNAAVESIFWWFFAVLVATLASTVIYGLRKEMRQALRLGQYTVEKKIGEGGMGVVYRARHAMLRRPTAVKLLQPEKAGERALARFEREVRLTASLTHANTVTIFDYGRTPDGVFYYAMELIEGATLQEVVEVDGPQPVARIVRVLQQTASALAEAHEVGLIHRDIKPANIMLCRRGGEHDVAKVCDFGLVKELDRATGATLSQVNVIAGTPQYIAPEAITKPDAIDGRSDIYALGAVGFYLLTGEEVFPGETVVEVCSHHLHTQPQRPSERLGEEVHPELEALILRCLSKDADDRPDAPTFISAIRALNIERWTESDAQAWWNTYGEQLEEHKSGGETPGSHTVVDVDVAGR